MKRLTVLLGLLLSTLLLSAQDYFLFFQSEDNQPYYVQMGEKTFSSSAIGHLIIPGLKDSTYSLNVGFPKDKSAGQVFQVRINKKDAGYQLKNGGFEGWGLFNFQTQQLIKAQAAEAGKQTISYGDVKKTDVFSTLMAGLVNDSAVLYTSIARVEPARSTSNKSLADSPDLKTGAVKQAALSASDTSLAAPVVLKEQDLPRDTALTKIESTKRNNTPQGDTVGVTSEVAMQEERIRKDTPVTSNTANTALSAVDDTKAVDSLKTPTAQVAAKPPSGKNSETKLLIISLGETRTSLGSEMVFYDMSSPEKTDTIKIFIPFQGESGHNASSTPGVTLENKPIDSTVSGSTNGTSQPDRNTSEVEKKGEVDETKQGEKRAAGNFFGKLFGRNANRPKKDSAKAGSSQKTSSIKVIDVENKKPERMPDTLGNQSESKVQASRRDVKGNNQEGVDDGSRKNESGSFLGKVFGRKNKANRSGDRREDSLKRSRNNTSSIEVKDTDEAQGVKEKQLVVTNSDCREFAGDTDVERLRTRMLGEKDADGQVNEARKFFKTKCFTTKQIKTLSEFFRTDEGKYKLFDAAYPFVSDTNNFKDLAQLLSEEYYINRFKAMVRK